MKLIITEDDIKRIVGRFIIQINSDDPIFIDEIDKDRLPFFIEKIVRFIVRGKIGITSCDLYGGSFERTLKSFVKMFNNEELSERFHRLLTQKEIDVVSEFIKLRQY